MAVVLWDYPGHSQVLTHISWVITHKRRRRRNKEGEEEGGGEVEEEIDGFARYKCMQILQIEEEEKEEEEDDEEEDENKKIRKRRRVWGFCQIHRYMQILQLANGHFNN